MVTDSSASLPDGWSERFGVEVVDLHLVEEDGEVVGTSAVGPEEMAEVYESLLAEPDCTGVVSAHLSAKLSRTWESAADAATRFAGRVLVVDSRGAGMALGAAVAQSAWAAGRGLGLSATYELANRLTRTATTLVAVGSLDSLRRGGRIGAAVALFGGALSMRPVLELRHGQLALAAKTRTTGKAHQKVRSLLRDEVSRGDVLVAVHHSGDDVRARDAAADMVEHIRRETPYPERVVSAEFHPVLGWHLGTDTVAVTVSDLDDPEFPIPGRRPQAAV